MTPKDLATCRARAVRLACEGLGIGDRISIEFADDMHVDNMLVRVSAAPSLGFDDEHAPVMVRFNPRLGPIQIAEALLALIVSFEADLAPPRKPDAAEGRT